MFPQTRDNRGRLHLESRYHCRAVQSLPEPPRTHGGAVNRQQSLWVWWRDPTDGADAKVMLGAKTWDCGMEAATMKKSKKTPLATNGSAIPELEHAKTAVLNSLESRQSRRSYEHAIMEFVAD